MWGSGISRTVNGYLDRAVTVARGVVNGAQSDRITFIAASLAYYALISLLPILLLVLAAAAAFGDPGTVEQLVERASRRSASRRARSSVRR